MACCALRPPSGLRDGAHPVAHRHRSVLVHAPRRRPVSEGRLPDRASSRPSSPAPRPSRSKPRSPTRSKRRSTPSAASTSCARPRRKACRWSSSASCSTRTATSPRRRCATRSTASCRGCRGRFSSRASRSSIPDAAPVLSICGHRQASRSATSPSSPTRSCAGSSRASAASARCCVLGGRQRQVNVWLDADRLRAYNLTVTDVSRALQSQNIEIPGGRVDQGQQSMTLRTRGRVQSHRRVRRHRRPRAGRPPDSRVADVARGRGR